MSFQRSFYFIRHGETAWNTLGLFQGSNDIPLNDKGLEQACSAAEKIVPLPIDVIVTSPHLRASKTAEIIKDKINKPLFYDQGLFEKCYGELEGIKMSDLPKWLKEHPDAPIEPSGFAFAPNAEPWDSFSDRVVESVHKSLEEYSGNVLFVSHTSVYFALCWELLGTTHIPDNAHPFLFEKNNDNWKVVKL